MYYRKRSLASKIHCGKRLQGSNKLYDIEPEQMLLHVHWKNTESDKIKFDVCLDGTKKK